MILEKGPEIGLQHLIILLLFLFLVLSLRMKHTNRKHVKHKLYNKKDPLFGKKNQIFKIPSLYLQILRQFFFKHNHTQYH